MKKILFLFLMMIFITSCGVTNRTVTLANVSVLSQNGEKLRTYNNVVLQEVPLQDTVYSIHFIEQNGTRHIIKNSVIVVEGMEQIVEPDTPVSTTSVIVYPYGYYYPYYRNYYYHYPRYVPRSMPDIRPTRPPHNPNHGTPPPRNNNHQTPPRRR